MNPRNTKPTLAELVLEYKGGRSNVELSRDCGGTPSDKRIHQIINKPINNFPDPETIRGLAKGLHTSEAAIIRASARSLNLEVNEDTGRDLIIDRAGELPLSSQNALRTISAELIKLNTESRANLDAAAAAEEAAQPINIADRRKAKEPTEERRAARQPKGKIGPGDLPHE